MTEIIPKLNSDSQDSSTIKLSRPLHYKLQQSRSLEAHFQQLRKSKNASEKNKKCEQFDQKIS